MVNLTIDGRRVEAEPGKTILEAASAQGIKIPSLCYHKALVPWGSCRLCVVEISGRPRLIASCACPVEEGIEVRTDSPRVAAARRLVAELLLLRCPEVPRIQELAREMGADGARLKRFKPDNENCILCGLCIRMCKERMGINAIDFINRGPYRKVTPAFGQPSPICQTCGACESVCPTGAINLSEITKNRPRPIPSEFDMGLVGRRPIYTPFPQAVPNVPVIDPEHCVYFLRDGKCGTCLESCERGAIDFNQTEKTVDVEVGAIIVATGYDLMDPSEIGRLGYSRFPNVITSLEFERLCNATGPTGGHIVVNGQEPKSVAIIHCVGSRDRKYHEYCSRVCCMYALKFAHLIKEKIEGASVYQFYIDMRCYGKGFEEFYQREASEGVTFIRGKPSQVTDFAMSEEEQGKLVVVCENTLVGRTLRVPVDMVILCPAMEARADARDVARVFNLTQSADGFLQERHAKLEPVATANDGMFVVGCAQGPKDIPDTVAQALAGAAETLALIDRGSVELQAATATVDETLCQGCGRCEEICVFHAPTLSSDGRLIPVSSINEALCKGCGVCAVACPTGAISIRHFTRQQILAELEALSGVPV